MQLSLHDDIDCQGCGFDGRLGTVFDAIRTVGHADDLINLACESLPSDLFHVRPSDGSATVADHIATFIGLAEEVRHLLAPDTPVDAEGNRGSGVTDRLELETALATATLRALAPEQMDTVLDGHLPGRTVGDVIRLLAHAVLHQQAEIAYTRRLVGDEVELGVGQVVQVSGSGGGLPKTAQLTAQVEKSGVMGDRQATRRHHGAPFQGLCLFSAEVIDDFASQGHPIMYGSAGENVTIRGLDWSKLRAGLELEIGGVTCRLTAPAVPCSQNSPWFFDGDFSRLSHTKHPGQSRWYASVVRVGMIQPGDEVQQTWS